MKDLVKKSYCILCFICVISRSRVLHTKLDGVTTLVADLYQCNSTTWKRQPIWDSLLFIVVTFEPIMKYIIKKNIWDVVCPKSGLYIKLFTVIRMFRNKNDKRMAYSRTESTRAAPGLACNIPSNFPNSHLTLHCTKLLTKDAIFIFNFFAFKMY